MNNNWNLKKLEKQASGNQEFDDYVLNISGILKYQNLNVLDIGCSNGFTASAAEHAKSWYQES